jgi:chromosomal replication initiation ATPase DnaA
MSTLTDKLDTFRDQFADLMSTAQTIARLIDVDTAEGSHSKRIGIIQRTVCEYFDLPLESMSSRVRTHRYAHPRQMAILLSRELTKHSLEDIAKAFRPDMDHGTVCHACASVADRRDTDKAYAATFSMLRARCVERIDTATLPLFDFVNSKKAS